MSVYLHIPAAKNPPAVLAAVNAAYGHPLPQVDRRGNPAKDPVETVQWPHEPAANGDGVVVMISVLYHIPGDAATAAAGCTVYDLLGAIMAGIIAAPTDDEGEPLPLPEPDLRPITEALPHQSNVTLFRELPDIDALTASLQPLGLGISDVHARVDPVSGRVAMRGIADHMPMAILTAGVVIADPAEAMQWDPVEGSMPLDATVDSSTTLDR